MSVPDAQGRVYCNWCDQTVPERHATSYDVSPDYDYYPEIRWICDNCKRRWFERGDSEDPDSSYEEKLTEVPDNRGND